jgi:signal transduction histidine kinase
MLRMAFGGVAGLLLASQLIGYFQWRTTQGVVATIEGNALTSVQLIGRMGFDLLRERILIGRDILEHDPLQVVALERQIATVKDDYAAAAQAYMPLVSFDGEASAWGVLTADVAKAERQAGSAIELSRANRANEAAQLLRAAEPAFEAVSRDVKSSIDINRAAAERARRHAADLEDQVAQLRLILAAATLVITLLVGRRLTQIVSDNERRLGQQTIELHDKNRELDAFAGRVAHELRGPLNTISLAAEVLAEQLPAGTTATMDRGVTRMSTLVTDLLELSRAGGATRSAAVRADRVVASIAADLRARVDEAGGTLQTDVKAAVIQCSEGLLRQALWNLGENAVKYRRPEVAPVVTFLGRVVGTSYEIRVEDNGIGMSADDARRAFEPFFRSKRTQAIAGTGLGLAIVRRIVEASGGTVTAESQLNHGTTIVLRIPLARSLTSTSV